MVEAWEDVRGRILAGGLGRGVALTSSDNMLSFVVCAVRLKSSVECRRRCERERGNEIAPRRRQMAAFREESSPLCDLGGHRGGEKRGGTRGWISRFYKYHVHMQIPNQECSQPNDTAEIACGVCTVSTRKAHHRPLECRRNPMRRNYFTRL